MTNKPKRLTKKQPSGWEDIADMLNHRAMMELKTGQVLTFKQKDGTITDLRIMRMTPYKCWVKKVRLYSPDEMDIVDRNHSGKS